MCIEGRKGIKVDPEKYAEVFQTAQPWPEVKNWKKYDWRIVRDISVSDLNPPTREDYEMDPDASEAQENLDRLDAVMNALQKGEELWPVVMGLDCMILDGYHRLAAAAELGIGEIDVIYPVKARTT